MYEFVEGERESERASRREHGPDLRQGHPTKHGHGPAPEIGGSFLKGRIHPVQRGFDDQQEIGKDIDEVADRDRDERQFQVDAREEDEQSKAEEKPGRVIGRKNRSVSGSCSATTCGQSP